MTSSVAPIALAANRVASPATCHTNKETTKLINISLVYSKNGGIRVCTVNRFVSTSAKFGTCTVVSVNGTLVEDKMRTFKVNLHILA
jgi:hypothetical protein